MSSELNSVEAKSLNELKVIMQEEIDFEALNELKELMEDEFVVLLDAFIVDGKLRLSELEEALSANNSEEVRKVAHSFKGSSANIGAQHLSAMCFKMETLGRNKKLEGTDAVLSSIREAFHRVAKAFEQLIQEQGE